MQNCLIISLCTLAIFVSIEAKPWCGTFGCNDKSIVIINEGGGYSDDDGYDADGSDENVYREQGYDEGGYDEGNRGDDVYRSDVGYGNRIGYDNRGKNGVGGNRGGGRYDGRRYGGGGPVTGGYDSNRYGNSGNGGDGYNSNGDGGYGGSRQGGRGRHPHSNDDGRDDYNYAYLPRECHGCRIKSFGNGVGNTNTFNLNKDRY